MLRIELRPGESVRVGDIAVITLEEKSGKTARLSFDADKSVKITRIQHNSPAQMMKSGLSVEAVA